MSSRVALMALFSLLALATSAVDASQGWYLLGPPADRLPKDLNTPAWPVGSWSEVRAALLPRIPLSTWAQFQAFDTAAACEVERSSRADSAQRRWGDTLNQPLSAAHKSATENLTYQSLLVCIGSDDPRLKKP